MDPATEHMYRHKSDQDLELLHIGPHDEGIATKQCEWKSKIDKRQRGLHQMLQVETHTHSPLSPCQVLTNGTEETKLEHDGSLHVAHKLEEWTSVLYLVRGEAAAHTHLVRCLTCALYDSGTEPCCRDSGIKQVFQPAPNILAEQQTSSESDSMGKPPISSRAARLMIYPDPRQSA